MPLKNLVDRETYMQEVETLREALNKLNLMLHDRIQDGFVNGEMKKVVAKALQHTDGETKV